MNSIHPLRSVVLYHNANRKKFRWIGFGALIQAGFVLTTVLVKPDRKELDAKRMKYKGQQRELEEKKRAQEREESRSWDSSTDTNQSQGQSETVNNFEPKITKVSPTDIGRNLGTVLGAFSNLDKEISYALVLVSGLFGLAVHLMTRRTISKVALLPNGKVRFSFFTAHGFEKQPPSEEFRLTDLSCTSRRTDDKNFVILKARNKRFWYLIDKTEGDFFKPELFDQTIGRHRSYVFE